MSRRSIIVLSLGLVLALCAPGSAHALSLLGGKDASAPAHSVLGDRSLDWGVHQEQPLIGRWSMLSAQLEAAQAPTEQAVRESENARKPQWLRPQPTLSDYALDLALAAAATFAWKRALNVTAARRILVESYDNWGDTLSTRPPINDGNLWLTNWVLHPMLGMYYYQWFRSRGHSRLLSALGVFLESTFHEYIIESSFEPASGIDIILTPGLGIPLGMLTDEVSVRWARSDSTTKRVLAYVMNPFLTMPWARWRRDISWDPREDRLSFRLGVDF